MLALPAQNQDTIRLADWLELSALVAADGSMSSGELERALHRTGTFEGVDSDDMLAEEGEQLPDQSDEDPIEREVLAVFSELDARAQAAGTAYPFTVEPRLLTKRPDSAAFTPYTFCLFLSYFGDETEKARTKTHDDDDGNEPKSKQAKIFPRRLFEHLATIAAANYVGGRAVRFGWPRRKMPGEFGAAIDELLLHHLREGKQFNGEPHFESKDRHVDIVAWKDFQDRNSSKIVVMGQCATNREERDWDIKKSELQPGKFWDNWIAGPAVSELHRAFFVPHRIHPARWDMHARDAGLLFDRCRVALYASGSSEGCSTADANDFALCRAWIEKKKTALN